MPEPMILWRLVNRVTISSLRGEARGQYDIRLTRPDGIEEFFSGVARSSVTDLGGFTLRVPLEAAVGDSGTSEIRVRYMGGESSRKDWYIASQRPLTAYPAWRLGEGLPESIAPDEWYIFLLRDPDGGFHGRTLRATEIASLPDNVGAHVTGQDVGVVRLTDSEWADIASFLAVSRAQAADVLSQRDELIVILATWFDHGGALDEQELDELADIVDRVAQTADDPSGRSELDIGAVLSRFESLQGGAKPADSAEDAVWAAFSDSRDALKATADAIRANLEGNVGPITIGGPGIAEAMEGRILTAVHVRRERSRTLRDAKVAQAGGSPTCEACGFDFAAVYGDRGQGFIECHHRHPLSELRPEVLTTIDDLALVCANCHRMIHRQAPWLTVEELKERLASD